MSKKVAVIAIGGNSLIKDKAHQSVQEQYFAADETAKHIVEMIKEGWDVVIGHGNGPQVGFLLQKAEIAEKVANLAMAPLEVCGAQSQGQIGYQLVQCLQNEMKRAGVNKAAACVIEQTVVSKKRRRSRNGTWVGTWWKMPDAAGAVLCLLLCRSGSWSWMPSRH